MSLAKYDAKRHFDKTPEPAGEQQVTGNRQQAKNKNLQFVIQKHHATQLHYDLRLEMDGVMKSWAVPKGPSLDPATKRLAMMVEDHPIEYNKFEGVIPEGNYGAGKVIIWDRGWYENDQQEPSWPASPQEGLKKGEVKFILHGDKLHGSFALIKTKGMGENAWLLIKHRDKFASEKDITAEAPNSVVSGKDVEAIGEDNKESKADVSKAPKAKMPKDVRPMLATLVKDPFDDPAWIYEIKWDGYRALLAKDTKSIELYSRTGQDFSTRYNKVITSAEAIKDDVLLDGEIVVVDNDGRSHFNWLQLWRKQPQGQLVYYVFDILWLNGRDLIELPLLERKQILQKVLPKNGPIKYSDHVQKDGIKFFKTAEKHELEGIIAKNGQSNYQIGRRSRDWLKIKTAMRQEVVVGGFTEPKGSRKFLGSLILGVYSKGDFVYVGHSGGAFGGLDPKELRQKLDKLEVKTNPFADIPREYIKPAHWVKPKLVCEVNFEEWTPDGRMRHPNIVGWRDDKKPIDVHRELPK